MSRMGKMIRSAKMKLTTPPKLIPPRHNTAASGTLPTEQTKLTMATSGPTNGPSIFASVGLLVKKNARQKESGTHAASAPAMSSPSTISTHTEAQSYAARSQPLRRESYGGTGCHPGHFSYGGALRGSPAGPMMKDVVYWKNQTVSSDTTFS